MDAPTTARALLRSLIERRVIAADLDHLLAVERLLGVAYAERWPSERLAGSIASVLASSPAQWEQVHAALLAQLGRERLVSGSPPAAPTLRERMRERMSERVELASRRWATRSPRLWVAGIAAALVVATAVVVAVVKFGGDEVAAIVEDEPEPSASTTDEADTPEDDTQDSGEVLPGETTPTLPKGPTLIPSDAPTHTILIHEQADPPEPRPSPPWLLVALAAISAGLAGLGLAWLRAPASHRRRVEQRDAAALEQRKQSNPIEVAYHVDRFPPFDEGRMDGTASILARLGTEARGLDLDVAASLRRTLEQGLPAPVMQPTHAARELLILVDVEHGDHPYLDGVNWLLDRWRRGGLGFVRYDFALVPNSPRHWPDAIETTIEALARRSEGMPMLLVSRGRALAYEHQTLAPWLALAKAWPKRVFVDLDPRAPEARSRHARAELDALREHGFVRVSFTPAGLDAAALHLAGRHVGAVVDPLLRPLAAVEPALRRWAAAAACVPEASWRQLEAIRRHFLDLREALPDPRYVQHLIDWTQQRLAATDEPIRAGARLDVGRLAVQLRAEQDEAFVHEAIMLILDQIEAANLERDAEGLASLRIARLEALLDPSRADELLRPFLGTALAIEARAVADELRRVDAASGRASLATFEGRLATGAGGRVPVRELRPTRSLAVWIAAPGLATAIASLALWWGLAERPSSSEPITKEGSIPRDLILRFPDDEAAEPPPDQPPACDFTAPLTAPAAPRGALDAPATGVACGEELALADTAAAMWLIRLSGGEFTMGSPESEADRDDDETQHRVALSRFAICATEVSAKQYELVMGSRPRADDADDLPARDVSWEDAARFMNALTRRENAERAAESALTVCYDEKSWAWDHRCTGYRLPSEAEWEYATRAGSSTRWWFGDDATQLCKYANVDSSECEDGFENVAPVATNRLQPNPWGLHGVHGNVWEWVFDGYDSEFYRSGPTKNPFGAMAFDRRSLRGGSFYDRHRFTRSASRLSNLSDYRLRRVGFRCARGAVPQP